MTDSMIERVRLALCREQCLAMRNRGQCATDDGSCLVPTAMAKVARLAIEAMREPTEPMVKTGWDVMPDYTKPARDDAKDTWRAMVDAALSEKP